MLKRFFRNKNAFGLKMVAFVVVALLIFVVVSVIVFPNLATEVKGIVGLIKECKRPAYNMDKYVSDINQALDILRDIEVYSSTGERIDIEIDADEFVIGIDQDFFVCAREDHINDSDFKQYKDLLFGPVQGSTGSSWEAGRGMAGAGRVFGAVAERMAEGNIAGGASSASVMNGRHMETIYRDFIKNLAEQCEVGALKDIKTYTKLYKERFPGGDYYTSIGAYTKTYKDCVNLKNKVQTLRQVNEYEQFKDVFETARSEIAASAASYDLTFAVQAYDSARNSVLYYVFGTTSAGGDIRSEAKKDADANYVIAIKDYGKFVGDYISAMHKIATYYGTGDGTKADRAAMYVSNAKSITSDDIEEADQFARVLRNKGETAVAQAFCIEANKAGPDKISYFIPGKTQVCSIS